MARVIAIRRKRIVRTTHRNGRHVTIAVRGVDIQVKPSRTARGKH